MHVTESKLRELISTSGLIPDADVASAFEEAERTGRLVSDVLVGRGNISEDHFIELLQAYYNVPIVNLKRETIESTILERIPETYAKNRKILLFGYDEQTKIAKLAMVDPFDFEAIEYVRAHLNAWVEPYLVSPSQLRYGLKHYKKYVGLKFDDIISEQVKESLLVADINNLSKTAEAVPVVSIIDTIMEHATTQNASDIHFEPLEKELLVRFRIDGIMQEVVSLPKAVSPLVVARVKILANLQIDEHRVPQDGRFRFEMDDGTYVDVRVNVMPVFHGEKVEMRLLRNSARPLTLHDLGLSKEDEIALDEEIKKPHGMVLVTGPTGHGKTTTLYAILHILNTPTVNITTIEDPVEYEFSRVNQTQVNVKAGVTFANGLRALLRQNPDIIMIGEIRDDETVDIAIHAALTGHLVLSSLHTNDATAALPRLIDMHAPAFLLASTVNVVIGQRLVRRICGSCITSSPISDDMKKIVQTQIEISGETHIKHIPDTIFKGAGCNVCGHSGFQGQVGIFEVFRVNDEIRAELLKQASIIDIRKQAISKGMSTMFEDGLKKVELGVTTIEEVLRVVQE